MFVVFVASLLAHASAVLAQSTPNAVMLAPPETGNPFTRFFTDAEWYLSWGTSKEYWSNSDIHVSQPTLGNDFTIFDVRGSDDGFGLAEMLRGDLLGPQFNVRIGRFFNDSQRIGIEFSLEHSKYQSVIGQVAQVDGTVNGMPTNAPMVLTHQFFSEVLHNGANHVMISGVNRLPLFGQVNETWSSSALFKLGAGVMLPHTTDTVTGMTNNVGPKTLRNAIGLDHGWWQLNGWTAGGEAALRFVLHKPVYLELSDKLAYAQLINLPAFHGNLSQSLWMNEIVLSAGVTLGESRSDGRR
jgi:hypothetical protein